MGCDFYCKLTSGLGIRHSLWLHHQCHIFTLLCSPTQGAGQVGPSKTDIPYKIPER